MTIRDLLAAGGPSAGVPAHRDERRGGAVNNILCIIPGPAHEYSRRPDTRALRWCFQCRKHLAHEVVVIGDPPEAMSYYEPIAVLRCPRCHEDHTLFPGWTREWEEES